MLFDHKYSFYMYTVMEQVALSLLLTSNLQTPKHYNYLQR
jgi:hypothetical protein